MVNGAEPAEVERLGPYLLLERLTPYGMVQPYVARRDGEVDLVVVKRLLPQLAQHPTAPRRFAREARLTRQLQHRHLIHTVDVGLAHQELFMVTEFVAGIQLDLLMADAVERGSPLPLDVVSGIALRMLDALAYAHDAVGPDGRKLGLVHRDLTPRSVTIAFGGEVKLGDFGVARSQWDTALTAPGTTVGTLAYMSPEQVGQGEVDARTDLYGFSVVLYELLTGTPMIEAQDALSLLRQIKEHAPVTLRQRRPDLPDRLTAVVEGGLAKNPADRWPNARTYETALKEALQSVAPAASTTRLGAFVRARMPQHEAQFLQLLNRVRATGAVRPQPRASSRTSSRTRSRPASHAARPSSRPVRTPSGRGHPGTHRPPVSGTPRLDGGPAALDLYARAPIPSGSTGLDGPPSEPTPEPSIITMPGSAMPPAPRHAPLHGRRSRRAWGVGALLVSVAAVATVGAWWAHLNLGDAASLIVITPRPEPLKVQVDTAASASPAAEPPAVAESVAVPEPRSAADWAPAKAAASNASDPPPKSTVPAAPSAPPAGRPRAPTRSRASRIVRGPATSSGARPAKSTQLAGFAERLSALREAQGDAGAFDSLLLDMKRAAEQIGPNARRAVLRDLSAAERAFDVEGLAQALRRLEQYEAAKGR